MRVSQLYGDSSPILGHDVYVIGLGASMSVFPRAWLKDKTCILLNDGNRWFPELGPVAVSNHRKFVDPLSPSIRYPVVKGRLKSDPQPHIEDNHVPWNDPMYYVFSYDLDSGQNEAWLWKDPDYYWVGGTVVVSALQFALYAGVRSVTLVGCDCMPLNRKDYFRQEVELERSLHSKNKKVREGKKRIERNYSMYTAGLQVMQRELWRRARIPVMTLTPFCGLNNPGKQLEHIKTWKVDDA